VNWSAVMQFAGLITTLLGVAGLICAVVWAVTRGMNTTPRDELGDIEE